MFLRERPVPKIILYNEASLKRLHPLSDLRPKIEEGLLKAWAGYNGECKVDRQLSTIDDKDIYIINDLCIPVGNTYFQIDSLILTKYVLLILEIKNISGHLDISNEFGQLKRTLNGEVSAFASPIAQCEKYRIHLSGVLKKMKIPVIPIEFLVVFTNPTSILTASSSDTKVLEKTVKIESLLPKIHNLLNIFHTPHLSDKELKRLSKLLLREHKPFPINKIELDFTKGVQCTNCKEFSMIRKQASWFCLKCSYFDKNAHVRAINDYFLLIAPTITNKQARDFLEISSPRTAQYLLNSMNLIQYGYGKGTYYKSPD
ncbi:nuclease-related domain-containing protein [Bacillus sp. Marseille-Q1617]|uniref:nuclease-related domain-containing protein n=1 Tax=Bacillus sp. Marseille-Q1617 TaxID=2736887 RepID=UPI00158963FA|nr:nuclease-related domain-containing protein [Bacillus sp. Marseille-Q1617]